MSVSAICFLTLCAYIMVVTQHQQYPQIPWEDVHIHIYINTRRPSGFPEATFTPANPSPGLWLTFTATVFVLFPNLLVGDRL